MIHTVIDLAIALRGFKGSIPESLRHVSVMGTRVFAGTRHGPNTTLRMFDFGACRAIDFLAVANGTWLQATLNQTYSLQSAT